MPRAVSGDTPPAAPSWRSLRRVPLLAGVADDRLRALWDGSVRRDVPAGAVLCRAGEPAAALLLLLRGRVSATVVTAGGRIVGFGSWSAPCALDKVAVLDDRGHTATLTALSACTVRALPRDRLPALLDDVPAVRRHVLAVLAAQTRRQQERYVSSATLPAVARLAGWLLERGADDAGRVVLPGSREDLAALLGVTRVTVSRALSRLRRDGVIRVEGAVVTLVAPELLALRAGGDSVQPPADVRQ